MGEGEHKIVTESQALQRMAAYCSRAERSTYDVRRKLIALNLEEDEIRRIIGRLQKEKFLDDERFCRSFINDKVRFNKWGEKKICYELKKRNIPEAIYSPIIKELSVDTFQEQLMQILMAKMKTVKARTDYDKRNKLIRFALGRGFQMELAIRCINKLMGNAAEDDM